MTTITTVLVVSLFGTCNDDVVLEVSCILCSNIPGNPILVLEAPIAPKRLLNVKSREAGIRHPCRRRRDVPARVLVRPLNVHLHEVSWGSMGIYTEELFCYIILHDILKPKP